MNVENPRFRPFETDLDEGTALKTLKSATDGADDGELFLERRRSEALLFDDGRVKTASYDASEGFGLRAVKGETAGYAHSTQLNEAALKRAAETARLAVGSGGGKLADAAPATNQKLYTDADPFGDAPFEGKVDLLGEIDAFARALDKRVVQVSVSMTASFQEIEILRPDGLRRGDARPLTRLNISIIVEENGRRETGSPPRTPPQASWTWCSARDGPASSSMKRLATALRATSTARKPAHSQASWANGSPQKESLSSTTAQFPTAAARSPSTTKAWPPNATR